GRLPAQPWHARHLVSPPGRGAPAARARLRSRRRAGEHRRDPTPPPVGEPPGESALSRRRAGGGTRSVIATPAPRRARAADARRAVVPAHVGADRREAGLPHRSARLDPQRPPRGVPVPPPARAGSEASPRQ